MRQDFACKPVMKEYREKFLPGVPIFLLFDLDPVTSNHIMDIFSHLACMVPGSFEIPGYHDVIGATGNGLRVLHHEGEHLPEY
jgi:hypothetical protein